MKTKVFSIQRLGGESLLLHPFGASSDFFGFGFRRSEKSQGPVGYRDSVPRHSRTRAIPCDPSATGSRFADRAERVASGSRFHTPRGCLHGGIRRPVSVLLDCCPRPCTHPGRVLSRGDRRDHLVENAVFAFPRFHRRGRHGDVGGKAARDRLVSRFRRGRVVRGQASRTRRRPGSRSSPLARFSFGAV